MTGEYNIRRATSEDIDKVIQINLRTLPENYTRHFFLMHLRDYPDLFYVAEYENEPVGYIMCRVEYGISEFSRGLFIKPVRKGHIISIAVLPEHRRRGLGTKLMLAALESMKNRKISEAYLEVRISNEAAINLYKKLNFTITRRVPGYYHDGEDAYIMATHL